MKLNPGPRQIILARRFGGYFLFLKRLGLRISTSLD